MKKKIVDKSAMPLIFGSFGNADLLHGCLKGKGIYSCGTHYDNGCYSRSLYLGRG